METPLQPSLLAPCSGQAVQLPAHPQRAQCWGGVCGAWLSRLHTPPRVDFCALSAALAAIPDSPRAPGPGCNIPRRRRPGSAGTQGRFSPSSSSTSMNGCSTELWEHFPEA